MPGLPYYGSVIHRYLYIVLAVSAFAQEPIRFLADKNTKSIHFIGLFWPELALPQSRLWRAI